MKIRALKYGMIWTGLGFGLVSLLSNNWMAYLMPMYAFGLVPFLELFMKPDAENMSKTELELARNDRLYDFMIYAMVPVQWALLVLFLFSVSAPDQSAYVIVGKIWSYGIGAAILGINVAHELGHRTKGYEKLMSKVLLLTSLYMHFFIEHNRGHHKNVSTEEDPASARRGEILYTFWFRSVIFSYLSAWKLENDRLRRKGASILSFRNEMINYHLIQIALVVGIGLLFSWMIALFFVIGAIAGFLLLETVNYIEHYGLQRKKLPNGQYERVAPHHSWNSDHPLGRLLLFELSRHSDHHYRAGRKYQLLRHMEGTPQMPTGYPGMMILSLFPPLWFYVMHRTIDAYKAEQNEQAAEMAMA